MRFGRMLSTSGALLAVVGVSVAGCAANGSPGSTRAARSGSRPVRAAPAIHRGRRTAAALADGDWPTFDYDAQRTGVDPAATGITAANVSRLRSRTMTAPGIVDSAPVELHAVRVAGQVRDVAIMTTSYGITFAIDPATAQKLWQFTPKSVTRLAGSQQVTTATPVLDPDRRYVYTTSPDGFVHKLSVTDGHSLWATKVTLLPGREKLPSSLNISGSALIVTTDGYYGDAPPYQGHVMLLDLASGRIEHIFNSLCSNLTRLIQPSSCRSSDSGIWGRSGSVVEPGGDILVATGNARFNGRTDWGDSVLELSPTLRLLHNWTPSDQQQLNSSDQDVGSTEPALLPPVGDVRLAVQGGKAGVLDLLDLGRLDGTTGPAGPRTGGQLQELPDPGHTDLFTTPAVWTDNGRTYVFVADGSGTTAYTLGANRRLSVAWQDTTAGTSPILAGGLLYVFDPDGSLEIRDPLSGRSLADLAASGGHWNSPIVLGGRVILPTGNYHAGSGTSKVYIFHLPGR